MKNEMFQSGLEEPPYAVGSAGPGPGSGNGDDRDFAPRGTSINVNERSAGRRTIEVLILGAGFAGKAAADALCKRLRKRGDDPHDIRVTVIDRRNYQLFTPMLYQAATGLVDPAHIVAPIRPDACDTGFRFVKASVEALNLAHRTVVTDRGNYRYDYLVVALGAVADVTRIHGGKEWSRPLKTLDDSIEIHNQVLAALEEADSVDKGDPRRECLLTFIVIGGSTGAELAGSLRDYLDLACRYYRTIDRTDCKVMVVERHDRLFPGGDEHLSAIVKRALEEKGVEVHLNTKVSRIDRDTVELGDGSSIHAASVFWNAGTHPEALVRNIPENIVPRYKDRVAVDEYLRVPMFPEVYVIGDCAAARNLRQGGRPKDEGHVSSKGRSEHSSQHPDSGPEYVAPTAEAALEEGKYVGEVLAEVIRGGDGHGSSGGRPFVFKEKGTMLSLGHRYGVVKFKHLTLTGFWGWVVWRAVHVALLSSRSGRFNVLVDWTVGSFKERNIAEVGEVPRLNTNPHRGRAEEEGSAERPQQHQPVQHK